MAREHPLLNRRPEAVQIFLVKNMNCSPKSKYVLRGTYFSLIFPFQMYVIRWQIKIISDPYRHLHADKKSVDGLIV